MSARSVQHLARWMIAAAAAHNFEEWLGRETLPGLENRLARRLGFELPQPPAELLDTALVVATVIPAIVLAVCSLGPLTRAKAIGIAAITALFLDNVLLPHAALSVAFAGYTPGVVTAVLVNLPLGLAILASIVRTDALGRAAIATIVAAGFVALPLAVGAAYAAAALLA